MTAIIHNGYLAKAENPLLITKREYIAAMALQGLLASGYPYTERVEKSLQKMEQDRKEHTAKISVEYADALLRELSND
jgi:hypothetical protein